MHSPHATWETTLVIPETTKPIDVQMLDALLRIEAQLERLIRVNGLEALAQIDAPEFIPASKEAVDLIEEVIAENAAPKKGKRK
jgi:hypothetical protein